MKKAKKSNQNRISSTERKVEKLNWTLLRWLYTKRKKSSIAFSRYSQFFQRKYGQISLFSKFKFLLSYRSRSFFLNKDNIPFNFFKRIFKLKIRNVNRKHGKWGRKSRKYKLKKKYKIFRGLILFNFKRSLFKSKKLKRRYRLPNQKFFLLSSQINFLNFDKYFQNQTNSLNQSKIKNLRLKVRRAGKSLIILLKLPKRFVFFRKWKNKRFRRSSRRVSLCKKTFQAPFYLPTSSPFIRSFSTFKTFANFFNFDNFLKDSDFSTNNFENLTRAKRIGLNLKLIKFHTKHGHFFKSQTSSFLLINDFFLAQILKTENVFILKRTMFSFIYKNDMQRFILRRYLKNRFVYFSQNAASSLDVRFSAPAFFFDNPNSVNLFTQLDFGNSFTQLNHLNWKKFMRRIEYSFDLVKRENDLSIKRVKFKPGYSTLWRNARSAIKMIMGLNFRYQRKLTRYLIKFYKYTRFQIFLSFELQLLRVLIRTKLLPDPVSANLFLTNGLVFLNGYCVYNSSLAIFAGDILQLVIHLKYYIVYRWLLHWNMQKKIRFKNKIRRKLLPKNTEEDKQRSNILPKWILTNKYLILDIPKYLEVDYLTLSAICVYSPFSWNDVDVYSFLEHRFGVINMYNWKYIT